MFQQRTLRSVSPAFSPLNYRSMIRSRLSWVWLGVLTVLTMVPLSATQLYAWPLAGWAWLWWLLPIGALLQRGNPWRGLPALHLPSRDLWFAMMALLVGATVATVASPFTALSAAHLWPTVSGVALLVLLVDQFGQQPMRRARVAQICAGFAVLFTGGSLLGWAWTYRAIPSLWNTRNDFPFGHANYTAGAFVLLTPWLCHAAWHASGKRRGGWLGVVGLALTGMLATASRGAILAMGGVSFLMVAAIVFRAPWSRLQKSALVAVFLILGFVAVLSNERLRDLALGGGWSDVASASNSQRIAMLEAGWKLTEARPFTGWGPGMVPFAFPTIRAQLDAGIDNVLQLHNTPLQLLATVGLIAVVVILLVLVWLSRSWWRLLRGDLGTTDSIELTAIASLTGYGIFCLTDHQFDQPFFVAFVAACAALAIRSRSIDTKPQRWLLLVAVVIPTVIAAPFTFQDIRARAAYADALDATNNAAIWDGLNRATELNPADPYYLHQAGSLAFQMALKAADPTQRADYEAQALDALERALASDVATEYPHLNLGWLHLAKGNSATAASHFRAAFALAPPRQDLLIGLALAERGNGQYAAGAAVLAVAFLHDPTDVAAPLWQTDSTRPMRDEAISWIQSRRHNLGQRLHSPTSRRVDLAARLDEIETYRDVVDRNPAAELPPPQIRQRTGYPVLAFHPDGPAPVDFQITQPPSREIVPARTDDPGIYHGLPVPLLVDLITDPPPPDQ